MKRRPELLSPAGDFERFEAALRFGADAVYLAGSSFGMRAGPQNFPEEDLIKAVKKAHENGVKVYLTLNTLPRNSEIPLLPDFIEMTAGAGVDAYIAADIGTMAYCKKYAPSVPLHVSTQAGIVNYLTANEFYNMGAERIVTARELSLSEIAEIRAKTPKELQIECFVHGSMCMSFSGRCLLSNYLTGRDANRGECAQPCRWQYALMEKTREGRYFPVNSIDATRWHIRPRRSVQAMLLHLRAMLWHCSKREKMEVSRSGGQKFPDPSVVFAIQRLYIPVRN